VPNRLLVRDMRFRTVAVTRGSAEVVFTVVSLALAPSMHGTAIVIGNLARQALMAAVYLTRVDRREWWVPQRLRWAPIRDLLAFGLPLAAACLADVVSSNWDALLVARFFGASTAGAYRLSRSLADTPMTNVAEHIGDVLLPSFVLMDAGRRNDAVVRSSAIISLIVAPLSVGLAAVAPTLVPAMFDQRWAGMAPMLVVLAALGLVRPVTWPLASFLQAQQRPRALMFLSFLRAAAMVLFLVTVGRLGPAWACLAVGLGQITNGAASLAIARRAEGLSPRDFLAGVSRPVAAAAAMLAAVTALRLGLPPLGVRGAWSLLALEVLAGAAVYLAAAWVLARPTVDDALQLLRRGMRRRTA
jgi:PST family polysaccharide transporter